MPTQKAEVGADFSAIMNRAMEPPSQAEIQGKDLPDGFPLPTNPHHRVVDTSSDPQGIEGLVAYDFKMNRKVFVIYRPWDHCDRCKNDIASNVVTLPDDGDYECPHNNYKAYKEVLDKCLAGHLLFSSEQEIVQKDGSIVMSLRWMEKTLNRKKARAAARAAARAQGIPESEIPGQQDEPSI